MTRRQHDRDEIRSKEVKACGVRRKDVDVNQLALAYYLLARKRIEEGRIRDAADPTTDASEGRAA